MVGVVAHRKMLLPERVLVAFNHGDMDRRNWRVSGVSYRSRNGTEIACYADEQVGRYHPLFLLVNWIVKRDRDIGLPYMGYPDVGFRLKGDGTLVVRNMQGDIPGTWKLQRGRLVIDVEGVDERAGYQWRALAQHLGWTPGDA